MPRLFVGLELPDPVLEQLLSLREDIAGARWQNANQLHLTLAFIGNVDDTTAASIRAGLQYLAADPFELQLRGVGRFGSDEHPRNLWVGAAPEAPLVAIHGQARSVLKAAGLTVDERPYKPHVTLARMGRNAGPTGPFLERFEDFRSLPFPVDHISLFRSTLSHEGSQYDVVQRIPLADPA
ncbi:MAG: RNA 2',3'-cyclic phosphodiesterase [Marinobacter sp.]|uniref:RNA 2',3'-cyclic phosphodiesterase n=1 Tax=Marinobacter sp. TaxID=50741 RepID=UPI00299D6EAC|nr:RNA 2',3'-cyclic phosphodiesterase [Marinobacter sp.]MDX1634395.1 RNA 2',3'-cyclic phosphodiesterase [Marinobacter sp.]